MLRRLMYHHHLINRDDNEIIKKVFMKQQKSPNKGDCVLQIITDFEFIDEQINEDFIRNTSKEEYSKYIKLKVEKATFRKYLQMKDS